MARYPRSMTMLSSTRRRAPKTLREYACAGGFSWSVKLPERGAALGARTPMAQVLVGDGESIAIPPSQRVVPSFSIEFERQPMCAHGPGSSTLPRDASIPAQRFWAGSATQATRLSARSAQSRGAGTSASLMTCASQIASRGPKRRVGGGRFASNESFATVA